MTQRTTWTDERLDEKMSAMDSRLDRIDTDRREPGRETKAGFDELRRDLNAGLDNVRASIDDLKRVMLQASFGLSAALLAILATAIIKG